MSWKSIEMQVALPRVQEAGKMQDQMLKQHQQFQDTLAQTHAKRQEVERQQVNHSDNVKNNPDQPEDQSQDHTAQSENCQPEDSIQTPSSTHPFLGSHIDLSR